MMHRVSFPSISIGRAILLGLVATAVMAAPARADLYGYAEQTTNNFSFTGATIGALSPGTSSSAVQTAVPGGFEAHLGIMDVLQSYVGPGPRPAENTFTPIGLVNPNYVRGDALITPTFSISNVAEGYLVGPGQSTGSGAWSVTAPITVAANGTVTLSFDFANQIHVLNTGSPSGAVTASYTFEFSIAAIGGTVLFDSAPGEVNGTAGLTSAGEIFVPAGGLPSHGDRLHYLHDSCRGHLSGHHYGGRARFLERGA
jgi:hypothetical protein